MGVLFSIQTVCIAECVTVKVSKAVVDNPNSKSNPRSLKANIDGLPLSYI